MDTKTITNDELERQELVLRLRKRLKECRENMKTKKFTSKDLGL